MTSVIANQSAPSFSRKAVTSSWATRKAGENGHKEARRESGRCGQSPQVIADLAGITIPGRHARPRRRPTAWAKLRCRLRSSVPSSVFAWFDFDFLFAHPALRFGRRGQPGFTTMNWSSWK
ncbi:MAG: hypothetical protein ACLUI3_17270 [Christensenellales bacterium]